MTCKDCMHYKLCEYNTYKEAHYFAKNLLRNLVSKHIRAKTMHPVISTMLPKNNKRLEEFLLDWCHKTDSAIKNRFNVTTSYSNYDVYRQFEKPLIDEGWQVIVFVPSKEEGMK